MRSIVVIMGVVGALGASLWTCAAWAEPVVQVRARTLFDGLRAMTRGQRVEVEGTLRDNLGAPVAGGVVELRGPGVVDRVETSVEGRFVGTLRLAGSGERQIAVAYDGSGLLAGTRAELPVRVGRDALTLRIDAPDEVDRRVSVPVVVAALDGGGGAVSGVMIGVDLDGNRLRQQRTDGQGRIRLDLPPLAAGVHVVRAVFAGSEVFMAAEVERTIEAALPLKVELRSAGAPGPGDPVVFDVRVLEGPASVRVMLTAEGDPVTDAVVAGQARLRVDPDDVEPGPVRFRAWAHTAVEGWRDAASAVVTVEVPAPPPPSPWWVRAPVILAALSLLGVVVRLRRRPRAAPPPRVEAPVLAPPFVFEESAVSGTGAIEVVVRDALSAKPVAATLVRLTWDVATPDPAVVEPPAGEQIATGDDGRARLAGEGDRLWAHAPGYAPVCHPLPKRGGRAVINLLPLRARLQTLYAEVLAEAGRPPLRFGRQTPREAAPPLVKRGAPDEPLAALTALVEEACFGGSAPTAGDLGEALRLAASVRAGLGA